MYPNIEARGIYRKIYFINKQLFNILFAALQIYTVYYE